MFDNLKDWRDEHRKKLSAVLKGIDLPELEGKVGLIYDLERARQLWNAPGFGGGGKIYPLLADFSTSSTGVYAKMQACYKDISTNTLPRAKAYEEYKQFVSNFAKLMVLVRTFEEVRDEKKFNPDLAKRMIKNAFIGVESADRAKVDDAIDDYCKTTKKHELMENLAVVIQVSANAFERLITSTYRQNIRGVYTFYSSKGIYRSLSKTRELATKDKPEDRRLASSLRSDSPGRSKEYRDAIKKLSNLANIAGVAGDEDSKKVCDSLSSMLFGQ